MNDKTGGCFTGFFFLSFFSFPFLFKVRLSKLPKTEKKFSMWLAQLQNCLLETKKKKKVIGRMQMSRKWIKLAPFWCHLSAWHYALQMVGGKRARHLNLELDSGSPAEWLCVSHLQCLSLCLFICKVGVFTPTLKSCHEN